MKVILKDQMVIVAPQDEEEAKALAAWKQVHSGHVWVAVADRGSGLCLRDLGPQADACREPINVTSRSRDPAVALISNFAATPFELDGRRYQSVESFWQGLKFEAEPERDRIAALSGPEAKTAGAAIDYGPTITYQGRCIPTGTRPHWELMERACEAKFTQNPQARAALLATGNRPLTHRTRRDSTTIPGVIMADIWMRIRERLQKAQAQPAPDALPADNRILFFKRDRARFGFLSNFAPAPILLDGETWPTVEHYYQAQKSLDPAYRAAIRQTQTPGEAKRRAAPRTAQGRAGASSWFVQNNADPRPDWQEVKLEIMRKGVQAKFAQNPELARRLLATGTAELIEDSRADAFWGMGRDGKGCNWLGRLLMDVRQALSAPGG
jgi:ribA/ribD-fused uncharacterized protein